MPRYQDEWVIERVLFDYMNDSSCSCCGIQHSLLFLPNGINDIITSMSDFDTDQMNYELNNHNMNQNTNNTNQDTNTTNIQHIWPKNLYDQIWYDRVKLKQKLKLSILKYTIFWNQYGIIFTKWLLQNEHNEQQQNDSNVTSTTTSTNSTAASTTTTSSTTMNTNNTNINTIQRIIQLSKDELLITILQQQYNIHSAYYILLSILLEQICNFHYTNYIYDAQYHYNNTNNTNTNDSNNSIELQFEQILQYNKLAGGFTLPFHRSNNTKTTSTNTTTSTTSNSELVVDNNSNSNNNNVLHILIDRIRTLGDSKLLHRRNYNQTVHNNYNNNNNNENEDGYENDDDTNDDDDDDDNDVDGPNRIKNKNNVWNTPSTSTSTTTIIKSDNKTISLVPAFQSDRRMLRLLIARYWADELIQKFYKDHNISSSSSIENNNDNN